MRAPRRRRSPCSAGQGLPGFTGGPVTAADGETVTIFVQDELLAADPTTPQRFADLLTSLLHGSELSQLTLNLATLDRVRQVCGAGALGCYSPRAMSIVALGQDLRTITARSIVTHEYGHHLANSRSNEPWPAVDWGTKRWASYENICKRSKSGELFPGDESENYEFNPGEDFAENYRVLNERRLGVEELPWQVVDASLYPDQTALDLLAQDITNPWTHATSTTLRGTFTFARDRPRLPCPDAARRVVQRDAPGARGLALHASGRRSRDREPARLLGRYDAHAGGLAPALRPADASASGQAGEGLRLLHADRLAAVAPSSCATTRRSSTNAENSAWRDSSSCCRRIAEGWIVAVTCSARSESSSSPRCCVTRKSRPRRDCAAVAPRQTMTLGRTTSSSASSHGRHAATSDQLGFWWIRRFPRACHLKCLTAFVT